MQVEMLRLMMYVQAMNHHHKAGRGAPRGSKDAALARAITSVLADVNREAEANLQPVIKTRLRRGVVASLAFLEEAVARAHLEIRKPHPNAVAVQLGGKAAVAVLQGCGVLQQFHVVDGRTLDVAGLADVVARAELLRQGLVERADLLAAGNGAGHEAETAGATCERGRADSNERARARVEGDRAREQGGVVISPHLTEPKSGFSSPPIFSESESPILGIVDPGASDVVSRETCEEDETDA